MKKFFLDLLEAFYGCVIRPHLQGGCRFNPSCRCFAREVFQRFPIGQALFLVLKRVSRCHPFGKKCYGPVDDPVPFLTKEN